jgi:putative lipoprotein
MACEPTIMARESRFFAALAATRAYELADDRLRLLDAAGVPLLGLVRAP